jgi:hypothetical protein
MTLAREPVLPTPRKDFTKRQKAQVYTAQKGICACGCNKPLPSVFDVDHRIPLANGGAHDLANWQGMIPACHRAKTREDVRAIAKCKRLIRKADPDTRKPPEMLGQPFRQHPTLKRQIGGGVVARKGATQ